MAAGAHTRKCTPPRGLTSAPTGSRRHSVLMGIVRRIKRCASEHGRCGEGRHRDCRPAIDMTTTAPLQLVRRMSWSPTDGTPAEVLLTREWLVTNGLGGYASGTVAGVLTRRYHGVLIAALPAPLGRTVLLSRLTERLRLPEHPPVVLSGDEH